MKYVPNYIASEDATKQLPHRPYHTPPPFIHTHTHTHFPRPFDRYCNAIV